MLRVANEPLTMTLDDAITKLNAQLTMTLDDATAKLSAHSDLDHRGIEILAATTSLRDTGGRNRVNALRLMCGSKGLDRRESTSAILFA